MRDMYEKGRGAKVASDHLCPRGHFVKARAVCATCVAMHSRNANRILRARRIVETRAEYSEYFHTYLAAILPATLTKLVECTDERRAVIVARFFGVYGYSAETGQSIAADLGVSRERVRQLRNHALAHLGASDEVIGNIPRCLAWKWDQQEQVAQVA
jgi:hypothetical protein